MIIRKWPLRPERPLGVGLFALALMGHACLSVWAAPSAPPEPSAKTASPAPKAPRIPQAGLVKLAGLARRIEDNARKIRRLSPIFPAPGYPREDMQRGALIRDNRDLLREAGHLAARLLDPVRREPPKGEWAAWQLLRDVESDTRRADLMGSWDFTDASIPRRLAAIAAPPAKGVTNGGRR